MLYREIIAVCSQIHTKHINTLCGQNVELLNVKLWVRDHWALKGKSSGSRVRNLVVMLWTGQEILKVQLIAKIIQCLRRFGIRRNILEDGLSRNVDVLRNIAEERRSYLQREGVLKSRMNEWGALVEWHRQGATEVLGRIRIKLWHCHVSTINLTWPGPGSKPVPRVGRTTCKRPSHGTTCFAIFPAI